MPHISRRQFLRTSVSAAGALSLHAQDRVGDQTGSPSRPNVLLIMTDQHRSDAMSAYGNPVIRTPHLDSLARDGVRFNNCWAQHPVCMPSRASIFTGRYPSAHGVRVNGVPLPRAEHTLAEVLVESGYRTGGAGKFHFLPHYNRTLPLMENHPDPFHGFSEFHIGEDGRRGEHGTWIKRNHPKFDGKPDHEIPVELHNSHWTASHTINFIRECANRREPFFAFCSFVDPHHGYNPSSPYREMYRPQDMPRPVLREGELADKPPFFQVTSDSLRQMNERVLYHRSQYYGEVTFIDDSIGRILRTLDELQLRENTLIVFTADHGDLLGDHGLFYKGPFHYRGCANLPLLIHWSGKLQAGKTVEGIVQEIDIFPTILDLLGINNPPGVQGKSLKDVLTTGSISTGYESALIEYGTSGATVAGLELPDSRIPDLYTLRKLEWRLSYYPGKDYGELYDLERDPNEFVNRWNEPALRDIRQKLERELLDRILQAHDPLPLREERY